MKIPKAFSLVEVVLSLGIASFALVGLIGLLPVGLAAFHDAINITVDSQIAQSLSNDIQLTDFNKIVSETRYYDDQGTRIMDRNSPEIVYLATVYTPEQVISPAGISQQNARKIRLEVKNRRSAKVASSYSVIVLNNNFYR